MTDVICFPIVIIGFKDVIGSWNTVAIFVPRIWLQSLPSLIFARFKIQIPCNLSLFSSRYFTRNVTLSKTAFLCSSSLRSTPSFIASFNASSSALFCFIRLRKPKRPTERYTSFARISFLASVSAEIASLTSFACFALSSAIFLSNS